MTQLTYCLAHGKDGESCEKREQCQRHTALRQPVFDNGAEVMIGTGCVQRDYQAFVGVENGA